MTLDVLLDQLHPQLSSLLGEGYKEKSIDALHRECRRKGRSIIRRLKPFARPAICSLTNRRREFPESYNPRAVHALFAAAFLYYSQPMLDLIWIAKFRRAPKRLLMIQDPCEFVLYMVETFGCYESMGRFTDKTIRLYGEMDPEFIKHHHLRNMSSFVEDQVVVVIDFTNPIKHVKDELERLLNELNKTLDLAVDELTMKSIGQPLLEDYKPSKFAMPVHKNERGGERYPKTYLPEWYDALMIRRLKLLGYQEKSIVWRTYGKALGGAGYESAKSTMFNRAKLAERLISAAFYRKPMTAVHIS